MIVAVLLAVVFTVLVVVKIRMFGLKYRSLQQRNRPLAGLDTGARSPFRVPRGVRFHKGL